MTGLLRLQATDPAVWDLTLRAVASASNKTPELELRCQECGSLVGLVGDTLSGPLFTSSWTVPIDDTATAALVAVGAEATSERGQIDRDQPHGVIALPEIRPPTIAAVVSGLISWLRVGGRSRDKSGPRLSLRAGPGGTCAGRTLVGAGQA